MVEVERPQEGCVTSGADKAGIPQDRGHTLRRVNKSSKRVAAQTVQEVFQRDHGPEVPPIGMIGERDQPTRPRGRSMEQRFRIGVAAYDSVKGHDVGVGQRAGGYSKVTEDELSGKWRVARSNLSPRDLKIRGRGIRKSDAGQAGVCKFQTDDANSTANVEKVELLERPAAEFCEEDLRAGVRAAALIATQVSLSHLGVEFGFRGGIASAAGHERASKGKTGAASSLLPLLSNLESSTYEILRLVLVVFQANLKLANRCVRRVERIDAVPTKIVS